VRVPQEKDFFRRKRGRGESLVRADNGGSKGSGGRSESS